MLDVWGHHFLNSLDNSFSILITELKYCNRTFYSISDFEVVRFLSSMKQGKKSKIIYAITNLELNVRVDKT